MKAVAAPFRSSPPCYRAEDLCARMVSGRSNNGGHGADRQPHIEVPKTSFNSENRDARSRFIAYVPAGSIKQGEDLPQRK